MLLKWTKTILFVWNCASENDIESNVAISDFLSFCLPLALSKNNLPRRLVEMYHEDHCSEIVVRKLIK